MNPKEKVFKVSGKKVESLLITDLGLLLSSQSFQTPDEFNKAWAKSLTLATKTEIKFSAIKSVTKEEGDDDLTIKYKGSIGMPSESEFHFADPNDREVLFQLLEKEHFFKRTEEQLSPAKAALPFVIGLLVTIGITIFAHYQAVAMEDGTAEEYTGRRARLFITIIEAIGDKGVWAVGILVSGFIAYKIWQRFTNPPVQIKLIPSNA